MIPLLLPVTYRTYIIYLLVIDILPYLILINILTNRDIYMNPISYLMLENIY